MFKSERSAKFAVLAVMLLLLAGLVAGFREGRLDFILMYLGLNILLLWAYLNPWVMQLDYSIRMSINFKRAQYNSMVLVGMLVYVSSILMMWW